MIRNIAIAVGAASLIAGSAIAVAGTGVAGTGVAGTGVTGTGVTGTAATSQASAATTFRAEPDIIHVTRAQPDDPPTSADCQQQFHVACYDPAQIQQAYNVTPLYNAGINGSGRTIAVVDVFGSPTISADLTQFDSAFSLPDPPSLRVIAPAGHIPNYNKNNADMVGWAGETTLDVEYAHALAPNAKILVVAVPESGSGDFIAQVSRAVNYVAQHHLADVISESFGGAEQNGSISRYRYAYQTAQRNHITVLASTGDTGATNPGRDNTTFYTHATTSWPATDPLVTAVGGTDVHLFASGVRSSRDTVWNDTYNGNTQRFIFNNNGPNPLGTGGGASTLFGRPSYQNSVRGTVGSHRAIPDISMSGACSAAVNVYQSFPGQAAGYYAVCGTSESAPLFAGIVALAVQKAGHDLGLINPALYKLSAEHAPGIVRVTSGNNTVSFRQHGHRYTVRGFQARNGYSEVAGVGTINAQAFVPELAKLA
ncbi:MAG TPA: S53 family peptidase [Streptosporangiaceae bacterium]|nr:S53 family peptidase [Streptosporangiaceae bacterium]